MKQFFKKSKKKIKSNLKLKVTMMKIITMMLMGTEINNNMRKRVKTIMIRIKTLINHKIRIKVEFS